MSDSILQSTKKALGLDSEYDAFDLDIIMFINSALATLHQVGYGPLEGFMITGPEETWDDLDVQTKDMFVKQYVYGEVRVSFDPPQNSSALEAIRKKNEELLWRININREVDDD